MIRFDFSGVTDKLLGERGIAVSDIEAILPALALAHETIMAARAKREILFYDLPKDSSMIEKVRTLAETLKGRFKNIVHLGIGGSSLGPKAIFSALNDPLHNISSEPRLFFMDNVDPELMHSILANITPQETLFTVVSKSGGTAETASQFMVVYDLLKRALGERYKEHLVLITDPEKGVLRKLAHADGIANLAIPPEVGGRFSVLTPVGLFPAGMVGIDIKALMEGAGTMADCVLQGDVFKNPAYLYAAVHFLAQARGVNISVLMPYSNALYDLADWYRQIWAESIGKKRSLKGKDVYAGQTPVKALGATDQHSQVQLYVEGPFDKVVNIIDVNNFRTDVVIPKVFEDTAEMGYLAGKSIAALIKAEARGTKGALIESRRMTTSISLDAIDARTLGALFMFFEAATACMGYLLDINPFDQPGVELGKQITFDLMGRTGYDGKSKTYSPVERMVIEI
ncbi:MAG: glucose-6-phosphate isomerase [Syntrophaceae bacterium]